MTINTQYVLTASSDGIVESADINSLILTFDLTLRYDYLKIKKIEISLMF